MHEIWCASTFVFWLSLGGALHFDIRKKNLNGHILVKKAILYSCMEWTIGGYTKKFPPPYKYQTDSATSNSVMKSGATRIHRMSSLNISFSVDVFYSRTYDEVIGMDYCRIYYFIYYF